MGLRPTLAILVLFALNWLAMAAHAQPAECSRPFVDRVHEVICTDPVSASSEERLRTQILALKALLHAGDFSELQQEQARWQRERRAACADKPANEEPECYADRAANRAIILRRQVDSILGEGTATLPILDAHLDVRWIVDRNAPAVIVTQLRHRARVLAEANGADQFDLVARTGSDDVEAIVVRARKEGATYSIVSRKGAPPEIWQYRASRSWMRRAPIVETKGDLLTIREQPEVPELWPLQVASTARLQWSPSTGWQIVEPFRARPPLPQPREFDGRVPPASDCTSDFERQGTIRLGRRALTAGEAFRPDLGQWLLAFGCDILIESGPNHFDLTAERQIGPASVRLSTEYNAGNRGFVARHVLADVAGHGVQVWEFPKSEVGSDNDVVPIAMSSGYLFLTPAYPGMDGGIFRWTPLAGFAFEDYRSFTPEPHDKLMPMAETPKPDEDPVLVTMNLLNIEEFYQALTSAAGPSFIGLAFDLSAGGSWSRMRLDRQWAPTFWSLATVTALDFATTAAAACLAFSVARRADSISSLVRTDPKY